MSTVLLYVSCGKPQSASLCGESVPGFVNRYLEDCGKLQRSLVVINTSSSSKKNIGSHDDK